MTAAADAARARRGPLRLVLHWLPAALTMAAIWVLSSMSHPPIDAASLPFRDRGAHFLAFGSVAFWVAHGTMASAPRARAVRVVVFAVLATALYGLLDEIHQSFVPGRSPDVVDLVADTLGAIVGAGMRAPLPRPGGGPRRAPRAREPEPRAGTTGATT